MKRIPSALLVLMLTQAVPAAETVPSATRSAEALEILEKADAAIKQVHSVRYRARSTPEGVAQRFRAPAEGTAVLSGWSAELRGPQRFYAHVKTNRRDSDETLELTGGGNGETYYVIDHGEKKGYEDMDPGVLGGGGRALQGVQMLEFVRDAPFDDELSAESVTLEGEQTVEGEVCYKVHVKYGGQRGESTWLISKSDFLPRGRIQHFEIPEMGAGKIETLISALEVNPQPEADLFRMQLPEGYRQIDDFMP